MDQLLYLTLPGWFIFGISISFGSCLIHQTAIILPYLTITSPSFKNKLFSIAAFGAGRIITYSLLGLGSSILGSYLQNLILAPQLSTLISLLLATILIALALIFLFFPHQKICQKIKQAHRYPAYLTGVLTALLPCPALISMLIYASQQTSPFVGFFTGFLFATGSSLAPLVILSPLYSYWQARYSHAKIQKALRILGGLILFALGWQLLLRVILTIIK